jgi:hypothetical protein
MSAISVRKETSELGGRYVGSVTGTEGDAELVLFQPVAGGDRRRSYGCAR